MAAAPDDAWGLGEEGVGLVALTGCKQSQHAAESDSDSVVSVSDSFYYVREAV